MKQPILLALVACVILLTAGTAKAGQMAKLADGKTLEILGGGPLSFSEGKTALMLKYRTASLDDSAALFKEAGDLWDFWVADVEKGGYQAAIITAESAPKGTIIQHSLSNNFVFEKTDGVWHVTEARDRSRLDKDFVTGFMNRIDWFYDHNEMNAFFLHLAKDWTASTTDAKGRAPETDDRMKFGAQTHATLAATKDFSHHRQITSIDIAENGLTATVKSTETEEGVVNGVAHKLSEDSTDLIELTGGHALLTKSSSVINSMQ